MSHSSQTHTCHPILSSVPRNATNCQRASRQLLNIKDIYHSSGKNIFPSYHNSAHYHIPAAVLIFDVRADLTEGFLLSGGAHERVDKLCSWLWSSVSSGSSTEADMDSERLCAAACMYAESLACPCICPEEDAGVSELFATIPEQGREDSSSSSMSSSLLGKDAELV